MNAEIIAIGDEMTSGQRLDTNSRWLSQQLAELGVVTVRHTTIADDLPMNIDAFSAAARRAEIVIATGGLGPTLDDLTREALAAAFAAPLELEPQSLERIEAMFALRKRSMPERNRMQAMLPRGSQVIPNPHGTAPGIDLAVTNPDHTVSRIFALPGVPAEMTEMWFATVRPRILQMLGPDRRPLRFHTIKLFGIGESDAEARMPDLMRRDRNPRVGITVSRATISLRIAAQAATEEEFAAVIGPTVAEIHSALGGLIFGEGEDELEHAVMRQLRSAGWRLAVLEIGPAALVADWLMSASAGDPPGAVTVLSCATIEHARAVLHRLVATTVADADSPSLPEMAQRLNRLFQSDLALVFSGYASPDGLRQAQPRADVGIALAGRAMPTDFHERTLIGHPDILNDRVAKSALDALRWSLKGMAESR